MVLKKQGGAEDINELQEVGAHMITLGPNISPITIQKRRRQK